MTAECAHCGTQTDRPESFFNELRSFRRSTRKVCPPCWQMRRSKELHWVLLLQVIGWAGAVLFILFLPKSYVGWLLLNLAFFQIAGYLSILPHELGHLAAAKLLGLRPFRMILGRGRVLLSGKLFNVPTDLRMWPV